MNCSSLQKCQWKNGSLSTTVGRSRLMSLIKSESSIEKNPFIGLYLRKKQKIFGKPDFSNMKRKIAVFIDGCYWHGCPLHYKSPKTNTAFWDNKIRSNILRDFKVNKILEAEGFAVIRIWEHELKK